MRPVINLNALRFDDVEENGRFTSRRAPISGLIGARDLGYNRTELPPGQGPVPVPQPSQRGGDVLYPRRRGRGSFW